MRFIVFFAGLALLSASLEGCTRRPHAPASAEVRYVGPTEPGTTNLEARSCGPGGDVAATQEAVRMAFETMLYRGIPGSEVNTALITNETEARQQHAAYWQDFYEKGRYRTFLMSTVQVSPPHKTSCVLVRLKINHAALRLDLEQHSVARRFGY